MHVRRVGLGTAETDARIAEYMKTLQCSWWQKLLQPTFCAAQAAGIAVGSAAEPAVSTKIADLYAEQEFGTVPTPSATGKEAVLNVPAIASKTGDVAPGESAGTLNTPQMQAEALAEQIKAAEAAGTYTPQGGFLSDWVDLTSGALGLGDFLTKYWWIPATAGGLVLFAVMKNK